MHSLAGSFSPRRENPRGGRLAEWFKRHSRTLGHAAFALLRVEDLHPQRLNQVLAKIAAREPDLRLAA
jgi:hypothetical protein